MTQPSVHVANLLSGKRGLIMGVANQKSIAWGIGQLCAQAGAKLAFTYQHESLLKRLEPLAQSIDCNLIFPCDVTDEKSIDDLFQSLEKEWGKFDFIVHAIAFSDREELKNEYVNTSLDNFLQTMHISCYSFTQIAQKAARLLNPSGSLITLTYYGAEKYLPNYNVMGVAKAGLESSVRYLAHNLGQHQIRVNALSAGPIKTLAAAGISNFRSFLKWNEQNTPMRRNVTLDDIARSGLYLASDLSSGVTGHVHYVDCGAHSVAASYTE